MASAMNYKSMPNVIAAATEPALYVLVASSPLHALTNISTPPQMEAI